MQESCVSSLSPSLESFLEVTSAVSVAFVMTSSWVVYLLMLLALTCAGRSSALNNRTEPSRQGKVFSLFNVISFKNIPCQSTISISGSGTTSLFHNGTCYTSAECSAKGGETAGPCAAGFGVCCVFTVSDSGSTISQNNTYIRNPGYPNVLTSTNSLQYTVQKCSPEICYLRLDFESFTLLGTGNTLERIANTNQGYGGKCLDFFQVTVNSGQNIPTICGQNAGQHMYVDLGTLSSDTATIAFQFSTTTASSNRQWNIKVSQIPCGSQYTPPEGCLQWYYGSLTGRFTTFNYIPTNDNHLRNQLYNACIRQEDGFCCVRYSVCNEPNAFSLASGRSGGTSKAVPDSVCSTDIIALPQSSAECSPANAVGDLTNRYCQVLNPERNNVVNIPVCACSAPFLIGVVTDNLDDSGALANANNSPSRGACLNFMQVPCGRSA